MGKLLTVGASVYVGVEHFTTLESWIGATAVAAGAVVRAGVQGGAASQRGRRSGREKDLFYLYQIGEKLAR